MEQLITTLLSTAFESSLDDIGTRLIIRNPLFFQVALSLFRKMAGMESADLRNMAEGYLLRILRAVEGSYLNYSVIHEVLSGSSHTGG